MSFYIFFIFLLNNNFFQIFLFFNWLNIIIIIIIIIIQSVDIFCSVLIFFKRFLFVNDSVLFSKLVNEKI